MLQIYNKNAVTKHERFIRGCIAGFASSLILAIIYGIISSYLLITFEIFYIAIGYGIGYSIQHFGRGVQVRFSVLGAICATFCFILADMISIGGFSIFINFNFFITVFRFVLASLFSTSINSLLGLLFRIVGIMTAYQTSRVI